MRHTIRSITLGIVATASLCFYLQPELTDLCDVEFVNQFQTVLNDEYYPIDYNAPIPQRKPEFGYTAAHRESMTELIAGFYK